MSTNNRIQSYIMQFNQVFNGQPWLDETFSKKLEGLTDRQVFTPSPNQNHSVAELVNHIVVWRMEVIRRLADNSPERKLTEESPDNWKPLPALQQTGWQQLYVDLKQTQKQLIDFLENKSDDFLNSRLGDTEWNKEYFIARLLHHDLYHLGMTGLILKWA